MISIEELVGATIISATPRTKDEICSIVVKSADGKIFDLIPECDGCHGDMWSDPYIEVSEHIGG
jgi:hypothetical protein